MDIKAFLLRVFYAAICVGLIVYVTPLLFALVGLDIPAGAAVTLVKFAFACLVLWYVFFGPPPPAPV